MPIAGIIAEYDPLHAGHLYQISRVRDLLGADTPIVCAMSGNFVQRGGFAIVRKHVRAEAAVRSGADLVLELPLPWAISSAEGFGLGGAEVLARTGIVTHLAFGSECADAERLKRAAQALGAPEFPDLLRKELAAGDSFAAARQRAVEKIADTGTAGVLGSPNNILGVEYCKALTRLGSELHRWRFCGKALPTTAEPRECWRPPPPFGSCWRRARGKTRWPGWSPPCGRGICGKRRQVALRCGWKPVNGRFWPDCGA
jgi:predicted nucleotidyltransferase